ncbi:uncharacterized protein LOC100576355 isoform X1 [Apis mellifera]|uniref:Uncharacterized protein LOC100576355 isoform X1 n=2 Tax=Apis mellifera TaxID=7460 RepID=A0A7M7GEQ9_APIME|nr:uncharacterized protein LOC100576355 isoform X1 [Apis mellifera]|eukprot:XP_003251033.1 uncharacterized protein LOC100576355 isoform X1 [Apis mellifera]
MENGSGTRRHRRRPRERLETSRLTMTMFVMDDTSDGRNGTNAWHQEDVVSSEYNVTTTASGAASKTSHFETDLHGNVNILLGGAMLSGVIMVVLLMCYCCHKSIRKNRPQEYPQYWRTEPDAHSLEVFTTEAHAACCERQQQQQQQQQQSATTDGNRDESAYDALSCPVTPISGPGPPPTYDSLIFDPKSLATATFSMEKKREGGETPGAIVPPMVSTLLGLSARSGLEPSNEAVEQQASDEGLPSYEAALKLDANGYV